MSLLNDLLSDDIKNQENTMSIYDNINNYKFDFDIKLGEGRFGKVRLAYHKLTKVKVAIKVIDKNQIKLKEDRQRIDSEILILKQLHHYHIAKLYSIIENEERIYLIQEYVQGNDLTFFIKQKEKQMIKEQKICKYFRQIISAIEYIHKLGIAHRDLKPENILINKDNDIKLIDFGLSKFFLKGELLKTPCGSPFYAAPEMVKGNKYNGINTDIWSLGIVLYLMLFQELPFMDADISRLYKKILEGNYNIPEDKLNIVSKEAIDLVKKILEINPKKRIKISEIKNHLWFNKMSNELYQGINIKEIILPIDEDIVEEINNVYGFDKMRIRNTIIRNLYNNIRSLYYILLQKKINNGKESIADLKSKLYIEYINDEKNKISNYDNNIENVLKNRMNNLEVLNEIIDYKENEEVLNDINIKKKISNVEDNSNTNTTKRRKNKKLTYINHNRNNNNNLLFENFIKMKTNDLSTKKHSKKFSQKVNLRFNLNENIFEKEKHIYSERDGIYSSNPRPNSIKNISHSKSISIKKKISNDNNDHIDIFDKDIILSKKNKKKIISINKALKKSYLAESYDKSKIISKKPTKQTLYKKNITQNNDIINKNNDLPSINKYLLDKINSNIKPKNNTNHKKNIKSSSLISSNNKSIDITKNKYNKKLKEDSKNQIKKANISELKLDNDNYKIKLTSGKTTSNFYHIKTADSKQKKLFNNNTINKMTNKKANMREKKSSEKKSVENNKKNNIFNNYKINVKVMNQKLRIKMGNISGVQNIDDNYISNSVNNINYNINNKDPINPYSTITNDNKKYFKSFVITNTNSKKNKNEDYSEKKILVNVIKKENDIIKKNNINQKKIFKSSDNLKNKTKKKINIKENKNNLNQIIFNQKNIINYQPPFDLSSLIINKNNHNMNYMIEKFLKSKKIKFNPIKDKNSKNLIYYNCIKKTGINFHINLLKVNKEHNDNYCSIYICKIRNHTNVKYDFIKFINSFNNYCK